MNTIKSLKKELEDLKKKQKKLVDNYMKKASKYLFDKFDILEAFGWRQYTGAYCDGPPCEFRSTHGTPFIKLKDEEDVFESDDLYNVPDGEVKLIDNLADEIADVLSVFTENDLKSLFGNQVSITVSRDGSVEVEEYDCGY